MANLEILRSRSSGSLPQSTPTYGKPVVLRESAQLPVEVLVEQATADIHRKLGALSDAVGLVLETLPLNPPPLEPKAETGVVAMSGSFSGAFAGDGRGLRNIHWSHITGKKKVGGGGVMAFPVTAAAAMFADTAVSSAYAATASFALNGGGGTATPTGAFTGSFTGAFQGDGSDVLGVVSVSHADDSISSSYATTASFALNGGNGASSWVRTFALMGV